MAERESGDVPEAREDARLTDTDFKEQKSLEAEAYRTTSQKRSQSQNSGVGYESYVDEEAEENAPLVTRRHIQAELLKRARQQVTKKVASKVSLRYAITVAAFVSFWQVVFAIISLIGFGIHAAVLTFREDSVLGNIIGFFVSFEKYFPAQYLGAGAWIVALFIGGGAFIAFILFFYISGVRMTDSFFSYLVLFLCLAVTILPVVNIIPGLLLWVVYLNATSLFSRT